jgi:hypothetical protein
MIEMLAWTNPWIDMSSRMSTGLQYIVSESSLISVFRKNYW